MTWVVGLDAGAVARDVVAGLARHGHDARLGTDPDADDPAGVVVTRCTGPPLTDLLADVRVSGAHVVVVLAPTDGAHPTGQGASEAAWRLLDAGAADVLTWDGDARPVAARLQRLREVDALVDSPAVRDAVVGDSPALRRALRDLVTAARFGSGPVLLLGETGTGKELAARVVHALADHDRDGDLVVVDCTTIVPTLQGSELFGHERGAFTGAVSVRTGACAAANGGTLLLDEVGELPLDLQPGLLRLVQEGTYKRVGGDTWRRSRFRLVCATHRDLAADVAAGRFRADLYHRIASSVVTLPPLAERGPDVVPLFRFFLARALRAAGAEAGPVTLSPPVEAALLDRAYPGNVRDLRQLARRVAARHVGLGPVSPGDLPPGDRPTVRPAGRLDDRDGTDGPLRRWVRRQVRDQVPLKVLREQVADLAVDVALQESGGSVRAAAGLLGVTDRALHLRRAQRRETDEPG